MDEVTNDLYKKYLSSCQEWIDHIRPIATQMFLDYKHLSGKIYYMFDNINAQPCNVIIEINEKVEVDENIKSIYKRLALKFHPDKFNHTFNSQLFAIINKHYTLNSINIMTNLDTNSEKLVVMDDTIMEVVVSNLSIDGCWENIEKMLGKSDGDKMNIMTTPYKSSKEENEGNIDFLSTDAYNFFINPTKEKERINKFYYTEEELINKIKTTSDSSFYKYYATHYIHVRPILQACTERLLNERNSLLLENEKLRARIATLKTT